MAEEISSVGLMGLPHFRSSRISRELHEPLYMNLFTATIQLPEALAAKNGGSNAVSDADMLLTLEEITKVDGLDTSKNPGVLEQTYKGAQRSYAGTIPDQTFIDIKIDFQVNLIGANTNTPSAYALKVLRKWNDLIYDPLTGRMGIKYDYVSPLMTIVMHDKRGNPYWQWNCYNVFPTTNITAPTLDFSQKKGIYNISGFTFRCDYWDEAML